MKLLIFVLVITVTTISSLRLTTEQKTSLENIAWLHAQFSLTFDGDELPLNNYFRDNGEQFELFAEVQNFFSDEHLRQYFQHVNMNELAPVLEQRIHFYQSVIVSNDKLPITFKTFYTIFKLFKEQKTFNNEDVNKYRKLWDALDTHTFLNQFCIENGKVNDPEHVRVSLETFEIGITSLNTKKLKKFEKKHFTLLPEYTTELEGYEDPKPKTWAIHHIIPSETLTKFYHYYFRFLSAKSEKIQKNHKFDWIKIIEFNTQKSFLIQASQLWGVRPTAKLPVNDFEKKQTGQQEDFVRTWYRFPPGLLFYGPKGDIRDDDPKNNFEFKIIHIVGESYYNKVKLLNDELVAFIDGCENGEELKKEAMRLYKKLLTIHREYSGKPILIFPFNKDQWLFQQQKWSINTAFNADGWIYDSEFKTWINMNDNGDDGPSIELWKFKTEWREKVLAQEADNLAQLNLNLLSPSLFLFSQGAGSSSHVDLKRRKRHQFHDPTTYIDHAASKCQTLLTTTTEPSKSLPQRDSCSYYLNGAALILAVPFYGLCFFGTILI
jgi:hypothetical protein